MYPAGGDGAIVRADGDGWSLVGRTGSVSFMLLDTDPNILHAIALEGLALAPGRALGPRSQPLMTACAYPD